MSNCNKNVRQLTELLLSFGASGEIILLVMTEKWSKDMEYVNNITDLEEFATKRERTVLNSLTAAYYDVFETPEEEELARLTAEHYSVEEIAQVELDEVVA